MFLSGLFREKNAVNVRCLLLSFTLNYPTNICAMYSYRKLQLIIS